jgi:hypothetical protein
LKISKNTYSISACLIRSETAELIFERHLYSSLESNGRPKPASLGQWTLGFWFSWGFGHSGVAAKTLSSARVQSALSRVFRLKENCKMASSSVSLSHAVLSLENYSNELELIY